MPRTKYIVVAFVILTVLLLVAAVYLSFKDVAVALGGVSNTALVIDAESDLTPIEVVVETNTTREDVRTTLRSALAGYSAPSLSPTEDSDGDVVEEQEDVVEIESAAEIVPPVTPTALCPSPSTQIASLDSWGSINSSIVGMTRSIVSLELDEFGIPLQQLNLPLVPVVEGVPVCPQTEILGIALDGRLIKSNAPFMTESEGLAGFALDGFGIFSKYENGTVLLSADLDQCHGHIHTIVWNGVPMSLYHYHVTDDAPYTIGCFSGAPSLP